MFIPQGSEKTEVLPVFTAINKYSHHMSCFLGQILVSIDLQVTGYL
jgi:hypothetical protein